MMQSRILKGPSTIVFDGSKSEKRITVPQTQLHIGCNERQLKSVTVY